MRVPSPKLGIPCVNLHKPSSPYPLFDRGVRRGYAGTKSGNSVESHERNTTTVVFHRYLVMYKYPVLEHLKAVKYVIPDTSTRDSCTTVHLVLGVGVAGKARLFPQPRKKVPVQYI